MRSLLRRAAIRGGVDDGRDRGYVLVFLSISLTVLMVFAAFTVDVGRFYSRGNEIQRAADAAALAGVVYMPDLDKATAAALDVAKLNGLVNNPADPNSPTISVTRGDTAHRLNVTITDPRVSTIFGKVVLDSISMKRGSLAEFVGAIPLGSPYNALGTGDLDNSNGGVSYVDGTVSSGKQNFWLAVNGFCTAKEDGDLKLSYYDGNHPTNAGSTGETDDYRCDSSLSSTEKNTNYTPSTGAPSYTPSGTPDGYEYVIDVPCVGRTDPSVPCDPNAAAPGGGVSVQVFNPVYDAGAEFPSNHGPDRLLLGWTEAPGTPTSPLMTAKIKNVRVTTYYELWKPTTDPNVWTQVNPAGGGLVTYNTCDSYKGGQVGYAPACNAGDLSWVTVFPSSLITTAGRWKVKVYTMASQANSFGSNQFALRAFTGGSFGTQICDSRVAPDTCPGVSGNSSMSVKADSSVTTAELFLSRLAPAKEFRGKQITVNLWDPGEGMDHIQILDPSGSVVSFNYSLIAPGLSSSGSDPATGSGASGSTNSLDVSGTSQPGGSGFWSNGRSSHAKYNDRYLQMTISVPSDYGLEPDGVTETPGFDGWWKIRYTAPTGASGVNDRTTWTVALKGDPVHLIRQ